MKKNFLLIIIIVVALSLLAACGSNSSSAEKNGLQEVKVGVSSVEGPVWDVFVEKAKEEGIDLKIIELSDWQLPNDALVNRDIDMNAFQNIAFLSRYNVEKGENLVPIGSVRVAPKGLYSEKYNTLSDIPNGSKVAIANESSNMGYDLKLLEDVGLIELNDEAGIFGTPEDIVNNPKNLLIEPMNPQQIGRVLPDVALAAFYKNMAFRARINEDYGLYFNDPVNEENSPYTIVFAVHPDDIENETYQKVAKVFQHPEIKQTFSDDTNGIEQVIDIPAEELQNTLEKLMDE